MIKAIQDVDAHYMRDDEWVFSGMSFTNLVWIGADRQLRVIDSGETEPQRLVDVQACWFINTETEDAFIGLHLEHTAQKFDGLERSVVVRPYYKWHGHVEQTIDRTKDDSRRRDPTSAQRLPDDAVHP